MEEYCRNVGLAWGEQEKASIAARVKTMGGEIINAKGRTHYGIATCVCSLADAVMNQRLTISSVSTVLNGEYGVKGVALSMPSIIGVNGVEYRLEDNWQPSEIEAFRSSAITLKNKISELGDI